MSTETTPSAATGDPVSPPRIQHRTTNPAPMHPFLDTSLPPINAGAPAELDSTPVSPVARKDSWRVQSGSTVTRPGADQEAFEELTGETGAIEALRQKRQVLLEERQKDPGVLVDIPSTPGPGEYEIATVGVAQGVARRSSVTSVTPAEVSFASDQKTRS